MNTKLIVIFFGSVFTTAGISQEYVPYWDASPYQMSTADSTFLENLERDTFSWFWEKADPATGLTPDRTNDVARNYLISAAAVGFGLTAYGIGSERGFVPREDAAARADLTLTTLLAGKMESSSQGNIGYRGWFYHFLDARNLARTWDSELSSLDTAWLLMGVIFVRNYFDDPNSALEDSIRSKANAIIDSVDWAFMLNTGNHGIRAGWKPESGFLTFEYRGYSEAMGLYLLALGADENALPEAAWDFWRGGYVTGATPYFSNNFVTFAPLFGHHYPQAWIDFRDLKSPELMNFLLGNRYDYFENGRRATYANRAYGIGNPRNWFNFGELEWGLTACDGPPNFGFNGYFARGASAANAVDDGTIAPTAAGGSIPYAPEICIPALRHLQDTYGSQLYGDFGFRDAFNVAANWFDTDYLGIDQGAILLMIENFRSELIWQTMRKDTIIQTGLRRAGFTGGWLDSLTVSVQSKPEIAKTFSLHQNFPNPFNPSTTIAFELQRQSRVRLDVFNVLGRRVATLLDDLMTPGSHSIQFHAADLPSGVYWYQLSTRRGSIVRKMLFLK